MQTSKRFPSKHTLIKTKSIKHHKIQSMHNTVIRKNIISVNNIVRKSWQKEKHRQSPKVFDNHFLFANLQKPINVVAIDSSTGKELHNWGTTTEKALFWVTAQWATLIGRHCSRAPSAHLMAWDMGLIWTRGVPVKSYRALSVTVSTLNWAW